MIVLFPICSCLMKVLKCLKVFPLLSNQGFWTPPPPPTFSLSIREATAGTRCQATGVLLNVTYFPRKKLKPRPTCGNRVKQEGSNFSLHILELVIIPRQIPMAVTVGGWNGEWIEDLYIVGTWDVPAHNVSIYIPKHKHTFTSDMKKIPLYATCTPI